MGLVRGAAGGDASDRGKTLKRGDLSLLIEELLRCAQSALAAHEPASGYVSTVYKAPSIAELRGEIFAQVEGESPNSFPGCERL